MGRTSKGPHRDNIHILWGKDNIRECGSQGEHKIARGYVPTETFSLHWIGEESFSKAVEEYLISEKNAVKQDIKILSHFTPFKKGDNKND